MTAEHRIRPGAVVAEELIRLPVQFSDVVQEVIKGFVNEHASEGVRGDLRWHGADMWMVQRDRGKAVNIVGVDGSVLPATRVTVAAWEKTTTGGERTEELVFIPDILLTGQYVPPGDQSRILAGEEQTIELAGFNPWLQEEVDLFRQTVAQKFYAAWQQASTFNPEERTH